MICHTLSVILLLYIYCIVVLKDQSVYALFNILLLLIFDRTLRLLRYFSVRTVKALARLRRLQARLSLRCDKYHILMSWLLYFNMHNFLLMIQFVIYFLILFPLLFMFWNFMVNFLTSFTFPLMFQFM